MKKLQVLSFYFVFLRKYIQVALLFHKPFFLNLIENFLMKSINQKNLPSENGSRYILF